MSFHDPGYTISDSLPMPSRPATWHLFVAIAVLQISSTLMLNRVVLSPEVYRSLLDASGGPGGDDLLRTARRWELLTYFASPLLLVLRVVFAALLVQLALLGLRLTPPFARIFRAGIWAQAALLLGMLIQTAWLASLPDGAIGTVSPTMMPGSFGAVLPPLSPDPAPLLLLLHQTTIFDLGWIALFILGLEEGERIPPGRAAIAVLAAWGVMATGKWAFLLLIAGMA
jgi:hypothetical protein